MFMTMGDGRRDKALGRLSETAAAVREAEAARDLAVARAKRWGATWSQIGACLGVTAQAAHRRFRTLHYDTKTGKTWHEPTLPI